LMAVGVGLPVLLYLLPHRVGSGQANCRLRSTGYVACTNTSWCYSLRFDCHMQIYPVPRQVKAAKQSTAPRSPRGALPSHPSHPCSGFRSLTLMLSSLVSELYQTLAGSIMLISALIEPSGLLTFKHQAGPVLACHGETGHSASLRVITWSWQVFCLP
jgi:hypothetical protein